jgi:hypothetical protein
MAQLSRAPRALSEVKWVYCIITTRTVLTELTDTTSDIVNSEQHLKQAVGVEIVLLVSRKNEEPSVCSRIRIRFAIRATHRDAAV